MTPQYLGNKDLLDRRLTAFLASRTVQTARVLACYDWATSLSAETDCVVSGFQSTVERDVLHFLLKKRIPIVVVLARAMYKHIPEEFREAYHDGRLLFISLSQAIRTNQAAAKARCLSFQHAIQSWFSLRRKPASSFSSSDRKDDKTVVGTSFLKRTNVTSQ